MDANTEDPEDTMAVATRRTPALGSPRSSDEPVSDTEPHLEYHGDTYFEPISADWRRTLATSQGRVVTFGVARAAAWCCSSGSTC